MLITDLKKGRILISLACHPEQQTEQARPLVDNFEISALAVELLLFQLSGLEGSFCRCVSGFGLVTLYQYNSSNQLDT